MIEGAAVRWKLVGFGFGEYFCQIAILLRDFRCSILSSGVEGGQIFEERSDRIEVEDVDLVSRPDFTG
jgi:hypothetical protein